MTQVPTGRMTPVPWFLAIPPAPRPEMVHRTAVSRLLDEYSRAYRATVVAAPSGFGKTVAVNQWAFRRRNEEPGAISWLTVTGPTGDAAEILRGVITALQRTGNERGDRRLVRTLVSAFDSDTPHDALTALARAVSDRPMTVVIDDVRLSSGPRGGVGLAELIAIGPDWLRLVIITTDPLTPDLSRLRMHGGLAVIGSPDLAMDHDEIRAAAGRFGRPVDDERVSAILHATDGWPAAVRLVLASEHESFPLGRDAELTEYIRSSVLHRMRPELAEFVLRATVASRLDADLLRALTHRTDWPTLIGECISSGLFIDRFSDSESTVYQWHSMFAAHCRRILRQDRPELWLEANREAAVALGGQYPLAAVEHAIHAGEASIAYRVIAEHWLELTLQSRFEALDRTCISTVERFGENAEILMIRACCRGLAGDELNAKLLLHRAGTQSASERESARIAFIADVSTLLLSDDQVNMAAAADRIESMLGDRTMTGNRVYACALFVLGWANSRLRRADLAAAQLSAAQHECAALGFGELSERARQGLAFAAANAGQFERALAALPAADGHTTRPEPWLAHDGDGIERFTLGYVRFWRGDLTSAREHFLAVTNSIGSGYPDMARMMLTFTVTTLSDDADLALAAAAVDRMAREDSHGVPWSSYRLACRARLAEAHHDRTGAVELAAQLLGRMHVPMVSTIGSGVCRRLGEHDLARQLAEVATEPGPPPYSRVYALLTLALIDWHDGDQDSAYQRLEHSLAVAAPEQIRFPYIDNADRDGLRLLGSHTVSTSYRGFLDSCLVACESIAPRDNVVATTPLTGREHEILALLRTPMTSAEIASHLSISINTMKTHQRAIYRKLGVANRRAAIRAAGPR